MDYAIILAGGVGSRFWPLSRHMEPKQFLNICSGRPMIQDTLTRINRIILRKNIYVAASALHSRKVSICLKGLSIRGSNFLFEPQGRNTLAPIALLSHRINQLDSDAVVVVMPSDHFVRDENEFLKIINQATEVARDGLIVTIGIKPTRPETGYGYIKIKTAINNYRLAVYKVDKFVEKPHLIKARRFIQDKKYYWNSGIFVFRPDVLLAELKRLMPAVYALIEQANSLPEKVKSRAAFARLWSRLPSISIDYGIMEKTGKTALVPGDYGWIDLGSWKALEEALTKDNRGNILKGPCVDLGSKNSLVWANKRLIATVGLRDIIIADTDDALLVCAKDKTQDVKTLVALLKQKKLYSHI